MRIIQVTESIANLGGAENYIVSLSSLLRDHGHDVTLVTLESHEESRGGMQFSTKLASPATLVATVRAQGPDVIIMHILRYPALVQQLTTVAPNLYYVHGFYPVCPGLAKYYRVGDAICERPYSLACLPLIYFRRCASARHPASVVRIWMQTARFKEGLAEVGRIVVASQYMQELLIQNGISSSHIEVLAPHFSCLPTWLSDRPNGPTAQVLFSGRIEEEKGLPYLLRAMAQLRGDWSLIVAGDGTKRVDCESLAQSLGIDTRVSFLGWVPADDMSKVYAAVDLLVMPTICPEAFGKAGVEALAHGIPVVAFDVGGISDWLETGVNGFLVPPCDTARLADLIQLLLSRPEIRRKFGARGRKMVASRYTPGHHARRWDRILSRVIAESASICT